MHPVYILSKGRWQTATTPGLFDEVDLPYTLVVEPHEVACYIRAFPGRNFLVLHQSHQGLWYARKSVVEQAGGWVWMIDDDIKAFYRLAGKSYVRDSARVLEEAEAITSQENLAQMTIARVNRELRTLRYSWNVECSGCVCVHPERLGTYRADVQEDTDMSLQVLTSGYKTVRCNRYALATPGHGENEGGQYQVYHSGQMAKWSANLSKLWGDDLVQVKKYRNGEIGVAVDWGRFRK